MGYIYIVRNDINNKVYIGKTLRTIKQRWKEHISDAYYEHDRAFRTHFHSAIRKYGEEHFNIQILEEVDKEFLSEREQFWINKYNSYEEGYNSTIGGEGAIKYDYQQFLDLWEQGYTTDDIANEFNCAVSTVYNALCSFPEWSKKATERRALKANQSMSEARKISVDCYDLKGNFLASYKSSREAAKALNISESAISVALKTGGRCKKYLIVKHGAPAPKPYQKKGAKAVNQYDLQGNFIATYEAAQEAALSLGKPRTASSSIAAVCYGRRITAYGYKWKWRDENVENN